MPAKRGRGADPGQTRRKLLDAAIVTLDREGYSGATARAIAAEAGCNQASIYYHFGGIAQLFVAALLDPVQMLARDLRVASRANNPLPAGRGDHPRPLGPARPPRLAKCWSWSRRRRCTGLDQIPVEASVVGTARRVDRLGLAFDIWFGSRSASGPLTVTVPVRRPSSRTRS